MTLAIYGSGLYGRVFLESLRQTNANVDFFIDQYTKNKEVAGIPVFKMHEVNNPGEVTVLISVAFNEHSKEAAEIVHKLNASGFFNLHAFEKTLQEYPQILPNFPKHKLLWMRPVTEEMVDAAKLAVVSKLLADQQSKDLLARIIAFRSSFQIQDYVSPDDQEEYFPNDVPWQIPGPLRFVDAGAYIGDTVKNCVQACLHAGQLLQWVISFEPDTDNIERYQQEIRKQMQVAPDCQFMLYPSGVWSQNAILSFSNDGTSSSNIISEGNARAIAVNALDAVLYGAKPNYIKLDVEGAELEALQGAENIIQDFTPQMAVCLYHKPADLWELPLFIQSLNPNYQFYLRCHGHMGLSTVLYCIPAH
ncbi:MAG: FkbM family methyltransferase [Methylococcaceae bacterium]|jgi:FkbM family methyltransferase